MHYSDDKLSQNPHQIQFIAYIIVRTSVSRVPNGGSDSVGILFWIKKGFFEACF